MHVPRPDVAALPQPQRLFFALLPDDALRGRIATAAARIERADPSGGRPLAPARYHLTLRFLGDFEAVPPALIAAARAAGEAVRARAFTLVLDHAGSFADSRVRWLGVAADGPLQALRQALDRALAAAGVALPAQAFVPHLTIVRAAQRALAPALAIDPLSWSVDGFALLASRPGRPYEILQRRRLA